MSRVAEPLRIASASVDETRALAARLAPLLISGDVILLGGDLGAGKTAFTQGLAAALGIREPVTSPTFTLVRSYDAAGFRLLHADVYRLEHLQEIIDLGLPELVEEGAVAVVEWGDNAAPVLLPDYLSIHLELGQGDDDRVIEMRSVGSSWVDRLGALAS